MSIRSFVTPGVFDPEALAIMDEAFDAAFNALDDMGQPKIVLEIIAQRIMEAETRGERDPVRLVESHSLGIPANGAGRQAEEKRAGSSPAPCVIHTERCRASHN